MGKNILITGSSGFLGSALKQALRLKGYQIIELTRQKSNPAKNIFNWSIENNTWDVPNQIEIHGVIHLAGAGIIDWLWTAKYFEEIRKSRVLGTQFLVKKLMVRPERPEFFISGSGIGFYGSRESSDLDENSSRGQGKLADLCFAWENEAKKLYQNEKVRTVILRTGMVLGPGKFIRKLKWIFLLGFGSIAGKGDHIISWIHIEDWVKAVLHCIDQKNIQGPVNLVSPHPVSNFEFSKTIGKVLNRPVFLYIPKFIFKCLPGKMGEEIFLASSKVHPKVLIESDFKFKYISIETAFKDLFHKK